MIVFRSVTRGVYFSGGEQPHRSGLTRQGQVWFCGLFFFLSLFTYAPAAYAECGGDTTILMQALVAEEYALRATVQALQASKARLQTFDADWQARLANPPLSYDKALARRLATLRRQEVDPKRRTLENLRAQHEEARRQWERGHQRLGPQLAEARAAYQAKTLTSKEFCRVQDTYAQALRLYLTGMQDYRQGMNLYARALDECVERFLDPAIKGFTDSRYWEELIVQLERGDFLHDILVPLTVNAIRGVPPDAPPE